MKRRIRIRIGRKQLIVAVLAASVLFLLVLLTILKNTVHVYEEYTIPARCDSEGSVERRCVFCGRSEVLSTVPALGHSGRWQTTKEPTAATSGVRELRCTVCGKLLDRIKVPAGLSPIPSLRLTGSGAGMTDTFAISAKFIYTVGAQTEAEALSAEGVTHVRMMFGGEPGSYKHSYVLNDFSVSEEDKALFYAAGGDRVLLYANNGDPTCARKTVSAQQWYQIASERFPAYARFLTASDGKDYTGYNTLLYIKNTKSDFSFAGIYTLTVPYSVIADYNLGIGLKYAVHETHGVDTVSFEYVAGDPGGEAAAFESLESALSGESASGTVNPDVAADYYCTALLTGCAGAFSDLYWITADGTEWFPVPATTGYERAYGADASETLQLQLQPDGFFASVAADSERIKKSFSELFGGVLSPENVHAAFAEAVSHLDEAVYREDCRVYKIGYVPLEEELACIDEWYAERCAALGLTVEAGTETEAEA